MRLTRGSFYVTGGTVPGTAACYVERTADSELLEGILSGAYVYVLDSRQMGKSSLSIRTLQKLNDLGFRTAFVDLTKFGVRNLTAEQWYVAMLREVGRGLNLGTRLIEYWKDNDDVAPVQRFFGALQDAALDAISGRIAIFVDEIDVTRSLPFDTDEFFAGIRQCYVGRATDPKLARLTFSLFGTATPAELIEDTRVSPFNIGQRVELQDFVLEETLILATELPGDSKNVLRRILYWTGGHPYLTQRLCQILSQSDGAMSVDDACRSLFLERRAKESDDNLAFVRNRLLRNELDVGALLELYRRVRIGKTIRDDQTNPLCSVLRMSGVVKVDNGLLEVRNRIYATVFDTDWVQEHLPDAENRRQKAAYRRGVYRASAIVGSAVIVVGGLALYGFSQARIARTALGSAKHLTSNLTNSERDLRSSLLETKKALGLAEERRVAAEKSQFQAKNSAQLAVDQGRLAKSAADRASIEAAKAIAATSLANSTLGTTLVATGMQRLDAGDAPGALTPLMAAMKLDKKNPQRSALDRIRLAYALMKASTLRQVWSGSGEMIDAEYMPGQRTVLTANRDGNVQIWNAESGKIAAPPIFQRNLTCVSLSKDGRRILTGNSHGDANWWDAQTGKRLRAFPSNEPVTNVQISDDGATLAIAQQTNEDAVVTIWNSKTGVKESRPYDEKRAEITSLIFSPTGKRLVVLCRNYIAKTVDLGDGLGNRSISNCYSASQAMFVRGGRMLLINGAGDGFADGVIQLCESTGTPVVKYMAAASQDRYATAFRLSRDGSSILTASQGGTLQVFDFRTGARRGLTNRSYIGLADCDLSPDGTFVSASAIDGSVRTWNVATGEKVGSFLWHGAPVTRVRFDSTGSRLLTCSRDGTARIWAIEPVGLAQTTVGPENYHGLPMSCWTSKGSLVATDFDSLYRWDPSGGWRIFLPGYCSVRLNGFPKGVRRILLGKADSIRVFDFDRERFITQPVQSMTGFLRNQSSVGLRVNERYLFYEFAPRRIRILDLDDGGKTICELALPHELGTTRNIDDAVDGRDVNVGLEILPKVNRILTTGPNGELDFWVLQTGKHVATVHVATAREARSITGYILSPDGSKCVIREGLGNDGTLVAVRPADGKAISRHIEGATYDFEASFSEDGTRFIGPDSSSLWDTRTWSQIAAYPNSRDDNIGAASMALHPQNCVFFCPCTRRLHSMKTGAPVSRPICKAPPRYSCYSDDGRFVAVSTLTELFVFDIHLNRCVGPITLGSTPYIGFTPDSKMVTTRTADRLRLWDPQTGEEVLPATPWDGNEWAVEFSPDGQSFSYSTGNHVSISSLPRDDRTVAQLEHAIDAVSQSSMETMTATKWSTLGRGLNDLNRHITGGRTKPASADAVAEDYSVDEAIRDIGLHEHDIHAFLDVAQTAARADQWTLAEQAIDQAMNAGAKGQGATFLKGFIDLQAGRYRDSEVGLAHALSKKGNRIVAGLLFQASVGARDYSGASLAFEKPYLGESVLASLRNISFAVLAQAAQGEEQVARARLADVIRRGRSGEPEHFDYVSTYMATVSATLDTGVAESPYILKVLGESDETDPFVAQALTLGLARSGQIARAKQRLAKVGAANTDPEYMMARVLVSQGAGVAYRNALDQCISGCQTIIDENDAHTFDGAVKIIRAIVLQREAKRKLAKI